jgi:hypothetical protein
VNVTQFIDQIINRVDNVSSVDSEHADRRTRHLEYLIEASTDIWLERNWPWRRGSTSFTLAAGVLFKDMPTDFGHIGPHQGVFDHDTGCLLDFATEAEILAMRELGGNGGGCLTHYGIFGTATTDFEKRMQFNANAGGITVDVYYQKTPPVLDESAGLDNLKAIVPAQYHQTVLIPAVRALARHSVGDGRYQDYLDQKAKGVVLMVKNERLGQDTPRRVPSFFGTYGR